jgi:pimeloyl-ACP methyl ester carboxylesterase
MKKRYIALAFVLGVQAASLCLCPSSSAMVSPRPATVNSTSKTFFKTTDIDGIKIFYREAGSPDKPTIVLLHGFPTSSHMFRNLIPVLAQNYHVIAPDYPGYGYSDMPSMKDFDYSFDHIADLTDKFLQKLGISKYSLYVMDYGAPIGFRIAASHPERIQTLIVQNGNAYDEGIDNPFWVPAKAFWKDPSDKNAEPINKLFEIDATKWQYLNGAKNPEAISPDNWTLDQALMDRPGNKEIQLQMFKSYCTNPPHYPEWQAYFRKHQPPTLIEWAKNDEIFPPAGAYPYKRDLKNVELHILDTGHFALEEYWQEIGQDMLKFLHKNVATK